MSCRAEAGSARPSLLESVLAADSLQLSKLCLQKVRYISEKTETNVIRNTDLRRLMDSLECPDVGGDSGEAVDTVDHAELLDGLGA